MGGFQNVKFIEFLKLGILVPVCFGTHLGSSKLFPSGNPKTTTVLTRHG